MIPLTSACRSRWLLTAGLALATFMAATSSVTAYAQTSRTWSNDESFILMKGGGDSSTMYGSTNDFRAAERLRKGKEPLLYFRRGGKSYLVRDAGVLRQAEAIVRPQQELGARQGELGSRQGALGARQAALGQRQAAVALRQVSGGRAEAAREQAALGRQQSELGRQQAALGVEQGRLGRQQGELARQAKVKLGALVDDALRRGLAQQVN
jgi:hypothetical protein